MAKGTNKTIRLGSGSLYILDFDPEQIDEICANPDAKCQPENLLGGISGGASLKYSAEWYTATDDSGAYQKTILTDETATLTSGVITWNGKTLEKLTSTASVIEDSSEGYRTVKLGGVGNFNGKSYCLIFKQVDKADGNCWVIVRGNNQGEIEFAFKKDEATSINAEFTCLSQDNRGTLITYVEEIDHA